MAFLTRVDDIECKNKLIYELIYGNSSIVTIVASGADDNLEPLKEIYKDREDFENYMKDSECFDKFSIAEHFTDNPDGNYSASLTFIKK